MNIKTIEQAQFYVVVFDDQDTYKIVKVKLVTVDERY